MKNVQKLLLFMGILLAFTACKDDDPVTPPPIDGGENQENPTPIDPPDPEALTGSFVDGAVMGLNFTTETQNGVTDVNGTFSYLEGEEVSFFVGDLFIGKAVGQALITPITLAATEIPNATIETKAAQNIAALLQTLDEDGDESNGINITADIANNLGISTIDFSSPIESTLGDIVLNLARSIGINLEITYPYEAANAMAASLGIEYETENLALTHFMPALRAYFSRWEGGHIAPSAIFKTEFDDAGNIVASEVISRFSGKILHELVFSNHNEGKLPTSGTWQTFGNASEDGTFPSSNNDPRNVSFDFNGQNQLATFSFIFDNGDSSPFLFEDFNEQNQPGQIIYTSSFTDDYGSRSTTITSSLSYDDNGFVTQEEREFVSINNSDSYSGTTTSLRNWSFTYDVNENISRRDGSFVFTDDYNYPDGTTTNSETASSWTDIMLYDGDNKLTEIMRSGQATSWDNQESTFTQESKYDNGEYITSRMYSSSDGRESIIEFANGIATSSVEYRSGNKYYEAYYNSDGSSEQTQYYYYENGNLSQTIKEVFGTDYSRIDRVVTYYFEDGSIDVIYDLDYENGILTKETGTYANGEIFGIWYYNEMGLVTRFDAFDQGSLWYYGEYEYESNMTRITFKFADGSIWVIYEYTYNDFGIETFTAIDAAGNIYLVETFAYDQNGALTTITGEQNGYVAYILYYSNGNLIKEEIYDENGNLIDVIDYTNNGGIRMPMTRESNSDFISNATLERRGTHWDLNLKENPRPNTFGTERKAKNHPLKNERIEDTKAFFRYSKAVQKIRMNQ